MKKLNHIPTTVSEAAKGLIEHMLPTGGLLVFKGPQGVGKRQPVRKIGSEWRKSADDRRAVTFTCMDTKSPQDMLRDIMRRENIAPVSTTELPVMTEQVIGHFRQTNTHLVCLANANALSPACIRHIPALLESADENPVPLSIVLTVNPSKTDLSPVEQHPRWVHSVHVPALVPKDILGALKAWDSRYAPLIQGYRQQVEANRQIVNQIVEDTEGLFERLVAFHQRVLHRYPEGSLGVDELDAIFQVRRTCLPPAMIARQLPLF